MPKTHPSLLSNHTLPMSINVLLTNPIWVLVTRMQTHTQAEKKIVESKKELLLKDVARANSIEVSILKDRLYKLDSEKPRPYGTIQAVREVYRESGIRGFWKGLIPTLIMVCNPSIQFMIYETLAKRLRSKRSGKELPKKNLTAMEVFLLGAIAKLGATVVTYPLLVVKSRLQAKQEIGRNVMSRYTGTIDAIIKMIRYEGLHGFYKGMGTKIVQSVFAASVLFMIKEELSSVVMAVGAPILSCSSRLGHLHFLLTDGGQTKYCTVKIFTEVDLVVLGEGGRVT
uniref:Uncharacterized protein n=1 Tax=Oryza meridionalis TaxID=40149 RepID=A0A0E0CI74_9ORYZ